MKQISPDDEKTLGQNYVRVLARALDILEAFTRHGPELNLTSLANLLNLDKATTYRMLKTLEVRGYVQRLPESRKYRLGVRTFELGMYFQNQLDVRRIALPFLNRMVKETREAAFLCVREGDEALCIERVEGEQEVNIFSLRVGGRQPLHCGAAPRALLAGLDEAELRAYAERSGLPRFTPYTLSTLEALLEDVQRTRQQGYTVSLEDAALGIAAVGAPIRDHSGKIVAAISLSGLASRYDPQRIEQLAQIVTANASALSYQMGFRERS